MSFFSRQATVKAALHREAAGKFTSPAEGVAFGAGGSHHKHVTMTGRVEGGKPEKLPPIADGVVHGRVDAEPQAG